MPPPFLCRTISSLDLSHHTLYEEVRKNITAFLKSNNYDEIDIKNFFRIHNRTLPQYIIETIREAEGTPLDPTKVTQSYLSERVYNQDNNMPPPGPAC